MDQSVTTLHFVEIYPYSLKAVQVQIDSPDVALEKAQEHKGVYFQTYEVSQVEVNGETMRGKPKNHSPRSYIGFDHVHTGKELAEIVTWFTPAPAGHYIPDVFERPVNGRPSAYIELKPGEKVYDGTGSLVFTTPATPTPPSQKPATPQP